jgi:tryptophan synthase alpha subunit
VVPLVAPTASEARIARLAQIRAQLVYYVSLTGVTGVRAAAPRARASFSAIADGVVDGSALVDAVAAGPVDTAHERVATLVRELAGAMPR